MKHLVVAFALLAGCSSKGGENLHAVGTYIGGGSHLTGSDDCTYSGEPGVFVESGKPEKGPRFVRGPGKITVKCKDTTSTWRAAEPTGVKLWGPSKVKVGAESELFTANLVAGKETLFGEANIEWQLGHDCANVAEFGPVLGAQDTGGRDRSRKLVAKAKGTCTVIVTLGTGNPSETFPGKVFQQEMLVTVQ